MQFKVDDPKRDKITVEMNGKIGSNEGIFASLEIPISSIPIGEIYKKGYRIDNITSEWAKKIGHGSIDFIFHLDRPDAEPFEIQKKETISNEALFRKLSEVTLGNYDENIAEMIQDFHDHRKREDEDEETRSNEALFRKLSKQMLDSDDQNESSNKRKSLNSSDDENIDEMMQVSDDYRKRKDALLETMNNLDDDKITKQKSDPLVDQIQKLKDENKSLKEENDKLQHQLKVKQEEIDHLHDEKDKSLKSSNKSDPIINQHIKELKTLSLSLQSENQKLQDKINLLLEKMD